MKISNLILIFLFFQIVTINDICFAAPQKTTKNKTPDVQEIKTNDELTWKERFDDWEKRFIKSNIVISEWFDGVADGLDVFLAGKRMTHQKNPSHVKIENSTYSFEGTPIKNLTNINVNLRLPNLEEYWQVKFTSYDETADARGVQKSYLRQTPREQKAGATLGVYRKVGFVRASFQPHIALTDPLNISHSLIFESLADFQKFQVNPKVEFFATPEKGVGVFSALNFKIPLTDIFSLALINEGEYQEKIHLLSSNNGFSIGQIIDDRNNISYTVLLSGNNRPVYNLISYNFSVGFSHLIYKRILDYQLVPFVTLPREENFRPIAGVNLHIGLYF